MITRSVTCAVCAPRAMPENPLLKATPGSIIYEPSAAALLRDILGAHSAPLARFHVQEAKGMGSRGPVPKRSDQRVRRNKDDVPLEKVTAIGVVPIPPLGLDDPHPLTTDLYESLSASAQSKYYEPSDWQYARFTLYWVDRLLKSPKPSSMILSEVNSMFTDLLVSEGARRRVRLEVERGASGGDVIDVAELFRQKLASG